MSTIKEVARLAGVSTSTVSRALSKKVPVDAATCEKVMQAVQQLGYRPNPLAIGLKEGRSRILALVVPDIVNPFFPKLVKSLERNTQEKGYSLILCDSGGDEEQEGRYLDAMKSHYVDGVLYISVGKDIERARQLCSEGMPLVVVNRDYDIGAPCITNDNRAGAFTMIDYLVRCGHRRISCLAPSLQAQHYILRYEGCLDAFRRHGITNYEEYLVHDVDTVEGAYVWTKKLLSCPNRPTAFFTFIDFMSIGIYSGVHDSGLSVPHDISVVGFDNISISAHMIPPLTTYEHPVDMIAQQAVSELVNCINRSVETGYRTMEICGSLIERKSLKRIGNATSEIPFSKKLSSS